MKSEIHKADRATVAVFAAWLSIVAAVIVLSLLVSLHVISPEFDPSWRMVSEYANGQHGWVLSLLFVAWAINSWALAFAIRLQLPTTWGKIGLLFLVMTGAGEAMAAVFDITHPLHNMADLLGIPCLPVAAMLISVQLSRTPTWYPVKKVLLWTANLTWVSVVIAASTFALLLITYSQAGGDLNASSTSVTALPVGTIGLVGWANRLLVVLYCVWTVTVAWQFIRLKSSIKGVPQPMVSSQRNDQREGAPSLPF